VTSVSRVRGTFRVYNFEVPGSHTYFAAGVLVHNACGVSVIGRFPAYRNLAIEKGWRYFEVPTAIFNSWSPAQQWAANAKFLDRAIARGDVFKFASSLDKAEEGTGFAREIEYLIDHGYDFLEDGMGMFRP
jgi:hypothetical protein